MNFKNFKMEKYLDNLHVSELGKICQDLYIYVRDKLEQGNQANICTETGIKAPTVSRVINGEYPKAINKIKRHVLNLANAYQVNFDPDTKTFYGGIKPSKQENLLVNDSYIGGPKGNVWKIIAHNKKRKQTTHSVWIRYLLITDNDTAELRVGRSQHDDYVGKWGYSPSGKHLDFEFNIASKKHSGMKDVYIRLIVGHSTSKPEILGGFMMHSHLNDASVSVYTIFAENISGSLDVPIPTEIGFENFELDYPEIARFFNQRKTSIYCPGEIIDLKSLKNENDEREDEENREKKQ